MADQEEPTPKIGPALALIGAVNTGHLEAVYATLDVGTVGEITDSCTELIRRMLLNAQLHEEPQDLQAVAEYVVNVRYVWPDVYIRRQDRLWFSRARKYGIGITATIMGHYLQHSGLLDEDDDPLIPVDMSISVDRLKRSQNRAWVLGAAYSTALIASAIADYIRKPLDERLRAYRAWAAAELLPAG